jgi:hypothetical protein
MATQSKDLILISAKTGREFLFPFDAIDTQDKMFKKIAEYVTELNNIEDKELEKVYYKLLGLLINEDFSYNPEECQAYYNANSIPFPTQTPKEREIHSQKVKLMALSSACN